MEGTIAAAAAPTGGSCVDRPEHPRAVDHSRLRWRGLSLGVINGGKLPLPSADAVPAASVPSRAGPTANAGPRRANDYAEENEGRPGRPVARKPFQRTTLTAPIGSGDQNLSL